MVHIPYSRNPSVDLISGQIQVLFDSQVALREPVRAGSVRALAVTSPTRTPAFPDLPTVAETYPGFEVVGWHGLWVPNGTPQPIIDRINATVSQVVQTDAVRQAIETLSFSARGTSQQDVVRLISSESRMWEEEIRKAGIKVTE